MIHFQDILYGELTATKAQYKLFQTREFRRLQKVSHSANPAWLTRTSMCDSKFTHSIGTAHLTELVTHCPDFADRAHELYIAALAHDIATPPFSHYSEEYLKLLYGVDHEQYAAHVLDGSEFAKEAKVFGVSLDTILLLICGNDLPLIKGCMDLDNLDGILRYGLTMGILCFRNPLYCPCALARAYRLRRGRLCMSETMLPHVGKWLHARRQVFQYLYSAKSLPNQSMILRALEFAAREGKLPASFFRMTDYEAWEFLTRRCGTRTAKLLHRLERGHVYQQVYELRTSHPTKALRVLASSVYKYQHEADRLAKAVQVEPEDVLLFAEESRENRSIHFLFEDETGQVAECPHLQFPATWEFHVLLNPEKSAKAAAVKKYVQDELLKLG